MNNVIKYLFDNVVKYLLDERLGKQILKKYNSILEVLFLLYNLIFYFFVIPLMIIIHVVDSLIYQLYVVILQ